jgi:hypothetical protein
MISRVNRPDVRLSSNRGASHFNFRELVDRIHPQNMHALADSGGPTGREIW